MSPQQQSTLSGAVDQATTRLRELKVPEAEIESIRQALLTAGTSLDPHAVPAVAGKNFGSRGRELALHTRLAHERFVHAIDTMASSFEGQSTSLRRFASDMQAVTEESAANLTRLRAHTEALRVGHRRGGAGGDR